MATEDNDPFDSATSEYLTMDDLATGGPGHKTDAPVGRLLIIWAQGMRTDLPGTNGTYDAVEARYVVLDGDTTEKIDTIPCVVTDGLFSAGQFVSKLKHRVGGKPLLGRVDSRPSTRNKKVLAYGFADPTETDKKLAREYLANLDPFA